MPLCQQNIQNRIPGLDLCRAAAVLMVLTCHWSAHFGAWLGIPVPDVLDFVGDTGVDLFFALSGFLIGRILIRMVERRADWRDLRVFLIRRAMRTLPLYFLCLAILLTFFPPHDGAGHTALRYLTLTQNLIAPMPADHYFAVTWSLAIEEWFYLLFGGGLMLLSRRIGGKAAVPVCAALFMIVPFLARLTFADKPYLVYTRLDEIAYGVLAAWLYARQSRLFLYPAVALAVGAALIVLAGSGLLPAALVPNVTVTGCAACLPAALRFGYAGSWLSVPVRWLASRSYAIYLIHLTILNDVVETGLVTTGLVSPLPGIAIAMTLPLLLAELSYRYFETPLLRWRPEHYGPTVAHLSTAVAIRPRAT